MEYTHHLALLDFNAELDLLDFQHKQLSKNIEGLESLITINNTINANGIDDSLITLLHSELKHFAPSIDTRDKDIVSTELNVSIEGIVESIIQFIKDLLNQFMTFLRKFFSSKKGIIKTLDRLAPVIRKAEENDNSLKTRVYGFSAIDFENYLKTYEAHVGLAKELFAEWGAEAEVNGRILDKANAFFSTLGFMVNDQDELVERSNIPKRTQVTIRDHGFTKASIEQNIDDVKQVLKYSENLEYMQKRLSLTFTSGFLGRNRAMELSEKQVYMKLVLNTTIAMKKMATRAMNMGIQQIDMMKAYR